MQAITLIAAVALVPLLLLTTWIWAGLSRPSLVLVLEGYQMVALAPAWPILAFAVATGTWFLFPPALIVAASHLAFCVPARRRDPVPAWVPAAPTISVFVANIRYDSERQADAAARVAEVDADVMVVNEMTDPQRDLLARAGVLDRYPVEIYGRAPRFGEMLLSRVPVEDGRVEMLGGAQVPAATVTVGRRCVRIHSVHVHAPKTSPQRNTWRRNLAALAQSVGDRSMPHLYAGDFNSTRWHGPFRALLAHGLVDAHDALGLGLTRSWIPHRFGLWHLGPVMRLDHALFTPGLFPTAITEVPIPGSDHVGFVVTLAVQQR